MRLSGLRKAARGRRLAWLALLALLFQQFGIVAYACTSTQDDPRSVPVMGEMTGMAGMADCDGVHVPSPPSALCDQHCNPEPPTPADMRAGQVPPLALPPPRYALQDAPKTLAPMQEHTETGACRSDPPPALRFCSLLI